MDDKVTACLAEVEQCWRGAGIGELHMEWFVESARSDIPRLLATVQAVLELADGWAAVGPPPRPAEEIARRACAREVQAAITSALLGEVPACKSS